MSGRFANNDALLGDPLSHLRDEDLPADVAAFHTECLPQVSEQRLLRAARVGKHPKTYEDISRGDWHGDTSRLVSLDGEEMRALVAEQDSAIPERGMLIVILTVSLAAFLQGHVQTSINGASIYPTIIDLDEPSYSGNSILYPGSPSASDWKLGVTNATPFFGAALLGCWVALPLSDRFGRKGSLVVAASMVFVTSILMAIVPILKTEIPRWSILLIIRLLNGVGMGIKAVNTPVLASETAIGYWRGTSILAWQLWVAFGIFICLILNVIFNLTGDKTFSLCLVLGAPAVPSIMLLCALAICPESPRFYMRRGPNFNPEKAYSILKILRRCELIAMRDMYLLHKSIQQEVEQQYRLRGMTIREFTAFMKHAKHVGMVGFCRQMRELFHERRLRNPLISSSIVALAQQLCGINIMAFYSGVFFNVLNNGSNKSNAMYLGIGFGAINFLFGLPAIRRIDTMGRRRWLLITIPPMAILMAAASVSFLSLNGPFPERNQVALALVVLFLYLHAVCYSPGLGPIPFTLAAESFPLSHREIGCAFAVAVNLLFAGFLSMLFPSLVSGLSSPGCLGLFSGFNVIAFVLVFLFVEETRRISLEDLDFIYAVPKSRFWRYQLFEYLPWFMCTYLPSFFRRSRPISPDMEDGHSGRSIYRCAPPPRLYKRGSVGQSRYSDASGAFEMRRYSSDIEIFEDHVRQDVKHARSTGVT